MRFPKWWYESLRRRDAMWDSIERARVDDELDAGLRCIPQLPTGWRTADTCAVAGFGLVAGFIVTVWLLR